MNSSAIHFTYNTSPNEQMINSQYHFQNTSAIFDREKEGLMIENNELKKNNEVLME
jgi:hypothetical protein